MKRIRDFIKQIDKGDLYAVMTGACVGIFLGLLMFDILTPEPPKPCSAYSEYKLYEMPARCIKGYLK